MLRISDLSVAHDEQQIIHHLSLEIHPGSTHALMGPNGSGKSTLAATIMGHPDYTVTNGSLFYNGEDITNLSPDKRARKGIFLAFQQPLTIPGVSIATMLKQARDAITGSVSDVVVFRDEFDSAMKQLQIPVSFADRAINEGCSGGERKRLEMLQLILLKPSFVILDEIDSGLDVDALKIVAHGLKIAHAENPALSVLMITHYNRMVKHVVPDHVHILKNGRIIQSGSDTLAHAIEKDGYQGAAHAP